MKYGLIKQNGIYTLAEVYGDYVTPAMPISSVSYECLMDELRFILEDLEDPVVIDKDKEIRMKNDTRTKD
jgi:hypothetical protein